MSVKTYYETHPERVELCVRIKPWLVENLDPYPGAVVFTELGEVDTLARGAEWWGENIPLPSLYDILSAEGLLARAGGLEWKLCTKENGRIAIDRHNSRWQICGDIMSAVLCALEDAICKPNSQTI